MSSNNLPNTQQTEQTPQTSAVDNGAAPGTTAPAFNLVRINALVAELELELDKAPAGAAHVQDLRDELETLRNVLKSPKVKESWVLESLHTVRTGIEEIGEKVETNVLKDSPYVVEIGRILGLV